jgi:uncharacterized membrane protein
MITIEDSIYIDRPVRQVFSYATDLNKNAHWQTDVIHTEQTSSGPFGEGATYRMVNRFLGQRLETEGVISNFVPDQRCTYQLLTGPVRGRNSFLFEPVNGGTRFTTRGVLELQGLKLAGFLVRRKARQQVRNDLQKLKRILEKQTEG